MPSASATTTFHPQPLCHGPTGTCPSFGTITGRYYADGGPLPLGVEPPRGLAGKITMTNLRSHEVFHPRENPRGYFSMVVPVGRYEVVASPGDAVGPMTTRVRVTVIRGKPAQGDLGIHMT